MTAAETLECGDARTAHEFLLVQLEALPPSVERTARQRILVRHAPTTILFPDGDAAICVRCTPLRHPGHIERWPCPDYADAATGLGGDL